ncbi:glycosyltransferase family 2 protein [Spirulina sp. CCNP1310]|uniref:glycosyltransferase family 2 protein n=1 Tax=Spirulina sp. CCNP1310 TaxID=3110249 RepID=UPI002B212432|nr:glycosyltransferase family 2 protein [Spirulina sp. CCNP1310]MEA5420621.1 glycosyltransferase family 2 protein [Spirulina sp. CCNP1310]
MEPWQLKTPVALILFNRPETTRQVFEAIRRACPPILFLIADGPRPGHPTDGDRCAAARQVVETIDWDCQVHRRYQDGNLGCGQGPAKGIDWVFATVPEAIILEDDCLPEPSFFRYCEELLAYYREDQRVMTIGGLNIQFGRHIPEASYYFSRYNHCWGWASWRRAWQYFDYDLEHWPKVREQGLLQDILGDDYAVKIWTSAFDNAYNKTLDCWDFQWIFANFIHHGLATIPRDNLIRYIGYTDDATHTTNGLSRYNQLATTPLTFPLHHPDFMIRHRAADHYTDHTYFDYFPSLWKRSQRKVRKLLGMPLDQSW